MDRIASVGETEERSRSDMGERKQGSITIGVHIRVRDPKTHGPFHLVTECQEYSPLPSLVLLHETKSRSRSILGADHFWRTTLFRRPQISDVGLKIWERPHYPNRSRFLRSRSLTFSLQSLTPRLNIDFSSARFQRLQNPFSLHPIEATHLFLE